MSSFLQTASKQAMLSLIQKNTKKSIKIHLGKGRVLTGLGWCGSFGGKVMNSSVDHLESCDLRIVVLLLPYN